MAHPFQQKFNFNNLIIFEMANNHQGSLEHAENIIRAMGDIARRQNVRAALKFQFRHIETMVHPDHQTGTNNKPIARFISTRLTEDQYSILLTEVKAQGLITIATPFDEQSVDQIERLAIEIIKIGSCSALDWPLLERVSQTGKPVICSTGGLALKDIDRIVTYFQHRGVEFALEHCVAIYPTPNDKFHLNQITLMRQRYPGIVIGFSTHEAPNNLSVVGLAFAKGARIFEKHVGIQTDTIELNKYSANPEEAEEWVKALKNAAIICGGAGEREICQSEYDDLNAFRRGVFTKKDLKKGELINSADIFFAIPYQVGQLTSGRWQDGLLADRDYQANEALSETIRSDKITKKEILTYAIRNVKVILNMAHIPIGHDFSVELSHHYGLENFLQVGCTIIEVINREYAKKLIILLPGQWHPTHYHKRKDETFQVLHGCLEAEVEGRKKILFPGDILWVPRGVWHNFGTERGVVFEEISSTAFKDDSFYVDKKIAKMTREERKTHLVNWGRYQFDDIEKEK